MNPILLGINTDSVLLNATPPLPPDPPQSQSFNFLSNIDSRIAYIISVINPNLPLVSYANFANNRSVIFYYLSNL